VAIQVSAIITSARITLLDPAPGTTWVDADFLVWANECVRNICGLKLNAYRIKGIISPLAEGTHQVLPAGGLILLDVYENVIGGTGNGRRITKVNNRQLLDSVAPNWAAATPQAEVHQWIGDPVDPTGFEVYPPNDGTGQLRALWGAIPAPMGTTAANVPIDDAWELAIKNYMIAQAYAANTERQDLMKATQFMSAYEKLVGARSQGEVAYAVRTGAPRGT